MTVLDVKLRFTAETVSAAYRHMAQIYHPDKTMGLGPDLQILEEQKMKEINAAHQVLKVFLETA
jgi:DnaJ-class molecular chaperone